AGPGTARTLRSAGARVALRRRGTPAAVVGAPAARRHWSSRPDLHHRRRSRRRSDCAGRAGRAYQRLVGGIDLIAMLGTREHAGTYVPGVVAEGTFDHAADLGIALHEPGRDLADEVAEHVVRNDELPVHVGAGAGPVDEHADALTHTCPRLRG